MNVFNAVHDFVKGNHFVDVDDKIDVFIYESNDEDDLTPKIAVNNSLEDWKRTWMGRAEQSVFISTLQKKNWPEFRDLIYKEVKQIHTKRFPYNNYLY